MRPLLIIISPPLFRLFPSILQTHKPVLVQTLEPESGIERLDISVVSRLTRPAEVELDVALVSPKVNILRDEFGAVIDLDRLGLTVVF